MLLTGICKGQNCQYLKSECCYVKVTVGWYIFPPFFIVWAGLKQPAQICKSLHRRWEILFVKGESNCLGGKGGREGGGVDGRVGVYGGVEYNI